MRQLVLIGRPHHAHIVGKIAGAEGKALHPRLRARDVIDCRQAAPGLDDRQNVKDAHLHAARAFDLRH